MWASDETVTRNRQTVSPSTNQKRNKNTNPLWVGGEGTGSEAWRLMPTIVYSLLLPRVLHTRCSGICSLLRGTHEQLLSGTTTRVCHHEYYMLPWYKVFLYLLTAVYRCLLPVYRCQFKISKRHSYISIPVRRTATSRPDARLSAPNSFTYIYSGVYARIFFNLLLCFASSGDEY